MYTADTSTALASSSTTTTRTLRTAFVASTTLGMKSASQGYVLPSCLRHSRRILMHSQESFYSKLKTFADEGNTNLYVSNLPKSMNEHELAQLFAPHKVCSSRILRNSRGEGRGVGFAR